MICMSFPPGFSPSKIFLLYMSKCFTYMYISPPQACSVPVDVRRGYPILTDDYDLPSGCWDWKLDTPLSQYVLSNLSCLFPPVFNYMTYLYIFFYLLSLPPLSFSPLFCVCAELHLILECEVNSYS